MEVVVFQPQLLQPQLLFQLLQPQPQELVLLLQPLLQPQPLLHPNQFQFIFNVPQFCEKKSRMINYVMQIKTVRFRRGKFLL